MLAFWTQDLGTGLAIDFDEESYRVQRVVEQKISERKYRRNQRRIERDKKRREEARTFVAVVPAPDQCMTACMGTRE